MFIWLEAIASRLEAIASRLEAVASRSVAIASRSPLLIFYKVLATCIFTSLVPTASAAAG